MLISCFIVVFSVSFSVEECSNDLGYLQTVYNQRDEIEKCIMQQTGPAFREVVCFYDDVEGNRFPEVAYEGYREYYPV